MLSRSLKATLFIYIYMLWKMDSAFNLQLLFTNYSEVPGV